VLQPLEELVEQDRSALLIENNLIEELDVLKKLGYTRTINVLASLKGV